MKEEQIKLAFSNIKQDMLFLENEISSLKSELVEIKNFFNAFYNPLNIQKLPKTLEKITPTFPYKNPTHLVSSTHNSTVRHEVEGFKHSNLEVSIGNEGVSTDKQTNTSTDKQTHENIENINIETNIKKASEILDSLDRLKREIRLKFKKITPQEMAVFSTIYQLEEQNFQEITYKKVASQLNLSESSIRDYVHRIIKKGIPLKKHKINNKKVILSVSNELKKIATLPTILHLREL